MIFYERKKPKSWKYNELHDDQPTPPLNAKVGPSSLEGTNREP